VQKEQLTNWLWEGIVRAGYAADTRSNLERRSADATSISGMPRWERPKQADHGDWATNIALQLAKPLGKNPREVATALKAALDA